MYKVVLHMQARVFYAKADSPIAKKIARCFRVLERTPRTHPNIKPLSGPLAGQFRIRAGDIRMVYLKVGKGPSDFDRLLIGHRDLLVECRQPKETGSGGHFQQ